MRRNINHQITTRGRKGITQLNRSDRKLLWGATAPKSTPAACRSATRLGSVTETALCTTQSGLADWVVSGESSASLVGCGDGEGVASAPLAVDVGQVRK